MDLKHSTSEDCCIPWTDERHSSFLSSLEESFVRRMFSCGPAAEWRNVHLPLDRYLPDSATESTRDLWRAKNQPKKRPPISRPASPQPEDEREESVITSERRTRRRSTHSQSDATTLHQVEDANDHKNERVEATECYDV